MPSTSIKLFGTEEPPVESRILKAGPLTAELDGGNLRYIRYQGWEAIRAVSYVVRDQFWGTFNPAIEDLQVEESDAGFRVTYQALCQEGERAFRYAAEVTGAADGTLSFKATGTPVTDFLTNRTGFVVLHPVAGVSGFPVEVLHVDGRKVETSFPAQIDPKQPIMDIRALSHEVCPGLRVTCTMEGDTFEMEDQRNWTDASYKTYVRPLGLPFPYELAAGEVIPQEVRLTFSGSPAKAVAGGGAAVQVTVGAESGALPDFALSLEPQHAAAALEHRASLAVLEPKFLSCYLDPRYADPDRTIADFKAVAEMIGTGLALEVVVPEDKSAAECLAGIAGAARQAGATIEAISVTHAGDLNFVMPGSAFPDTSPFDELFAAARAAFPDAALGGGNLVYFTELNRKPPPFASLDFVCHTTCAIVHAADDRSVTETIECLPYVIASGQALFGGKPCRLGPSAMATRTSPFGADPPANPNNERVATARLDPRQRGLLGAAWHLGYAARAAEGGVPEVILGAPLGEFGLLHHPLDYAQPWYDKEGGLYPVYHVMRALYAASGQRRHQTEVSAPRDVQALAFNSNGRLDLWLANLTGETQEVEIVGLPAAEAEVCRLDQDSFEVCAKDIAGFDGTAKQGPGGKLTLSPYGVCRLRCAL